MSDKQAQELKKSKQEAMDIDSEPKKDEKTAAEPPPSLQKKALEQDQVQIFATETIGLVLLEGAPIDGDGAVAWENAAANAIGLLVKQCEAASEIMAGPMPLLSGGEHTGIVVLTRKVLCCT